jgi:hypothetical protein
MPQIVTVGKLRKREEELGLAARLWLGADAAAAETVVRADKLTAEDSVIVARVQLMGQTA